MAIAAPGSDVASGIQAIAASPDAMFIRLAMRSSSELRLVRLHPYESFSGVTEANEVWRGRASARPLRLDRFENGIDLLFQKLQLVDSLGAPIGEPKYATALDGLHERRFPFPKANSIKGLQVQMVEDAVALGVHHAAINVGLGQVVDLTGSSTEKRIVDGDAIAISEGYLESLDRTVSTLTKGGAKVYLILLNFVPNQRDPANPFHHPNTDFAGRPNGLGAFNTTNARGLRHYRAAVETLAERYSRPGGEKGWIEGLIVGNEVQSHWEWHNIGHMEPRDFVKHYAIALRMADIAARRWHRDMKVYASLDHYWTAQHRPDRTMTFPGKELLDGLNAETKREGDFPWHVAFHPYPENLRNPRFWLDKAPTHAFDTPKITFKNQEVLAAYLRRPEMRCDGEPRRVIYSEQGLDTPETSDGEEVQAAAYALAYYRISKTSGVDAFILHRHVDHKQEFGLRLGLWTFDPNDPSPSKPQRKKRIYEVFQKAGTPEWREAFDFALGVAGLSSWEQAGPKPVSRPRGSGEEP